jgi:hypothetical protein
MQALSRVFSSTASESVAVEAKPRPAHVTDFKFSDLAISELTKKALNEKMKIK